MLTCISKKRIVIVVRGTRSTQREEFAMRVHVVAEFRDGKAFMEASGLRAANDMAAHLIYDKGAKRVHLRVVDERGMLMAVKSVHA